MATQRSLMVTCNAIYRYAAQFCPAKDGVLQESPRGISQFECCVNDCAGALFVVRICEWFKSLDWVNTCELHHVPVYNLLGEDKDNYVDREDNNKKKCWCYVIHTSVGLYPMTRHDHTPKVYLETFKQLSFGNGNISDAGASIDLQRSRKFIKPFIWKHQIQRKQYYGGLWG